MSSQSMGKGVRHWLAAVGCATWVTPRRRILAGVFILLALSVLILTPGVALADNPSLNDVQKAIRDKGLGWTPRTYDKEFALGLLGMPEPDVNVLRKPSASKLSLTKLSAIDWRDNGGNYVSPIQNQASCGSCWAFSAVAGLESEIAIAASTPGTFLDLSEQIVLSCETGSDGCNGGYIYNAAEFLKDNGTAEEDCFPYTATNNSCSNACSDWRTRARHIDSYTYIDQTPDALRAAVVNGPVVVGFYVYADFKNNYGSGVYEYASGTRQGGHAVLIVGYQDTPGQYGGGYFIVKNSWGATWGEQGYFRIGYSQVTNVVQFGADAVQYHIGNSGPTPTPTLTYTPGPSPTPSPTFTPGPTPTTGPGGWVTIKQETFEGAFPGAWELTDNYGGAFGWGQSTCRPYQGTYSGWAIGGGLLGSMQECGVNYPDSLETWMTYGPFSLADATAAEFALKLWEETEPDYDRVYMGASIDGQTYYCRYISGSTGGWIDRTLDLASVPTLGNLTGRSQVWIGVIFKTDLSINFPEGAYVDNIVVRKYTSGPGPVQTPTPTPSPTVTATATPSQVAVPVLAGWNMISLPVVPASTAVADALSTIAGHYDVVYVYDATNPAQPWKRYAVGLPSYANTLTQIDERMGLWLHATSPATLSPAGRWPSNTTIQLKAGWNLVGYPTQVGLPVAQALSGIAGKYTLVFSYDASTPAQPWHVYNVASPGTSTLTTMGPGNGYWIQATQDCAWVLP
jgi:hypothetical protein